jgi:anti-sigma factor RsiW
MGFLKMTDKEIIEKIHQKLDGELNDDDLRQLENYLAGHPQAARVSKELELIKLQM